VKSTAIFASTLVVSISATAKCCSSPGPGRNSFSDLDEDDSYVVLFNFTDRSVLVSDSPCHYSILVMEQDVFLECVVLKCESEQPKFGGPDLMFCWQLGELGHLADHQYSNYRECDSSSVDAICQRGVKR
jgi:hypothetical protein